MNSRPARIVFLANCLEPGRDGVGDVTSLLADYLAQQGYVCILIAMSDSHLPAGELERESGGINVSRVVRISSCLPWAERTRRVRSRIEQFQPDLISLQFVNYALQKKGIVFPVIGDLQRMVQGYPLQMMFHELWVGAEKKAPLKYRLIGGLQRMAIQRCLWRLQPMRVHASNPTYVALLRQAGIPASRLPIASGISLTGEPGSWIEAELQASALLLDSAHRPRYLIFGHFGTLHPVWPPEPLISEILTVARRLDKTPLLLGVGRLGPGQALWDQLVRDYSGRLIMIHLGARSNQEVSQFFNFVDYGIAATPWQIIGKSSVAVAMLEHGLPVIANRELAYAISEKDQDPGESGLIRMGPQFIDQLVSGVPRRAAQSRLPEIARIFISENHLSSLPSANSI